MASEKIQISPAGEGSKPKSDSGTSGGSSILGGIFGGSGSADSGSSGGKSGGGGMGSSWSWIADIVAVVGSTATSVLGYDMANRAYKYDLMHPRPVQSQQSTMTILIAASAVLIMAVLIIYAVKSPKQSSNVGS